MPDPYIDGTTLRLDPLAPGSICVVSMPSGVAARLSRDDVTSWAMPAPGAYRLGITENGEMRQVMLTLEASAAERLAAWRAAQVMDRDDCAIALWQAGHISQADAESWATGTGVPQAILDAIATVPPAQRARWRVKLRGALRVRRSSPEFEVLRNVLNLSEAQADALFGQPPA